MTARSSELNNIENVNLGSIVVSAATSVVKNRPVSVSLWVVGLLLAAFATGFSVHPDTVEEYSTRLEQAQVVESKELSAAIRNWRAADNRYYNSKGWFSCDDVCNKLYDKAQMARAEVRRVEERRDRILTDARRQVGIWSVFGVRDVRASFWRAWQEGKDFATRYTMMDALFMVMGREEETLVHFLVKVVFQYIMNLTIGLVGAFFFFIYNVYSLVVAYGEPFLSGLAFFLLVLVAGVSTVGTYLIAVYGTVAGGGYFLVKQAAKNAALEGDGRRQQQRYVQYGGGSVGGRRAHYD